jgi:hypothetical protein
VFYASRLGSSERGVLQQAHIDFEEPEKFLQKEKPNVLFPVYFQPVSRAATCRCGQVAVGMARSSIWSLVKFCSSCPVLFMLVALEKAVLVYRHTFLMRRGSIASPILLNTCGLQV